MSRRHQGARRASGGAPARAPGTHPVARVGEDDAAGGAARQACAHQALDQLPTDPPPLERRRNRHVAHRRRKRAVRHGPAEARAVRGWRRSGAAAAAMGRPRWLEVRAAPSPGQAHELAAVWLAVTLGCKGRHERKRVPQGQRYALRLDGLAGQARLRPQR